MPQLFKAYLGYSNEEEARRLSGDGQGSGSPGYSNRYGKR